MSSKFKIGYIIFIFTLSALVGSQFFVKNKMLNGLDNLNYVKGQIEYYQSKPSPMDDSDEIRKVLHIKLKNSSRVYRDGFALLSALDKNKFVSLMDTNPEISLGVFPGADENTYYDIVFNEKSLVDREKIISQLNFQKLGAVLFCVVFMIYGFYELRKVRG